MISSDYNKSSSIPISIPISIPTQNQPKLTYKELGLTHTCFDPSKMTPPNYFMDKLAKRMDTYYSSNMPSSNNSSRSSSPTPSKIKPAHLRSPLLS